MAFLKHFLHIKLICIIASSVCVVNVHSQNIHQNLGKLGGGGSIDNRCFLRGGGSTLSFFVKESLPVDSMVGRLDIQGDIATDIELILGKAEQIKK